MIVFKYIIICMIYFSFCNINYVIILLSKINTKIDLALFFAYRIRKKMFFKHRKMHCSILVTIFNMDICYIYGSINTNYRILIKV